MQKQPPLLISFTSELTIGMFAFPIFEVASEIHMREAHATLEKCKCENRLHSLATEIKDSVKVIYTVPSPLH